jgi:hypothetical protein
LDPSIRHAYALRPYQARWGNVLWQAGHVVHAKRAPHSGHRAPVLNVSHRNPQPSGAHTHRSNGVGA